MPCSPVHVGGSSHDQLALHHPVTLASDRHKTYVAHACLPHLTTNPTALLALVTSLQGNTASLRTFFLQMLV